MVSEAFQLIIFLSTFMDARPFLGSTITLDIPFNFGLVRKNLFVKGLRGDGVRWYRGIYERGVGGVLWGGGDIVGYVASSGRGVCKASIVIDFIFVCHKDRC